ncbi:hypothetical protein C0J52_15498 [Blattella germanica]|nr:hypothetical protein C0J52_15498 [Blattella germanica]
MSLLIVIRPSDGDVKPPVLLVLFERRRATLQEWALIFYGTAVTPDGHEGHNPPLPSLRVTNSASSLPSKPILKPVNKPVRPPTVHSTPFTASKKLKPNQKNSTKIGKLTPPRTLITTTTPSHVHILKVLQPTSPSNIKNRLKSTTTAPGRTSKRPSSKAITPLPTLFPHILTNVSLSTDPPILTTLPSTSTIRHTTTAITTKSTTTAITSTTSDSELTILLETPSHIPPKMSPDIFKQYPKIQKVYPVYALSKSRVDPSSFHPSANLVPNLDLLQEETQHLQVEGKGSWSINSSELHNACYLWYKHNAPFFPS